MNCVVDGILRTLITDFDSYVVLKEAVSTIRLPVDSIMKQV